MASVAPAPGTSGNVRRFSPPRSRARLRVGVFADCAAQPRWLVESLARVAASDFAELVFVTIAAGNPTASRGDPLFSLYRSADARLFGEGGEPSSDVTHLVAPTRRIAASLAASERIDVAVALGAIDTAALDGIARHGIWRHCFGAAQDVDETRAALAEVAHGDDVVASGLRIRRAGDPAERVACGSWSRTVPFSLERTRAGFLPKTAHFLSRALRELHAEGPDWFDRATVAAAPAEATRAVGAAGFAHIAARAARRVAERQLTVDQWQLALRFEAPQSWDGSLAGFTRLVPPRDRFWADPFAIEANGRYFIFFEELPFATGKGHISVVEVDRDGRASEPRRVLERDYHLSYPFLVEDEARLYMIPESAHNQTVEAYRCVEFPHRWKLERVLMRNTWRADATFHRGSGRWWMFSTQGEPGSEVNDELEIHHSPRLLGDWEPIEGNPVRSDVRGARPAGRLFEHEGALYRPGQICAPIYGAGLALHRVLRLDERGYEEEEVQRIVPAGEGGVLGLHTLNRAGALTVTDLFVRRPRFEA